MRLISSLNFKINVLCLDREFYSSKVFTFLQNNEIPHIVPVVRKGKKIKALLDGKKSRYESYLMKSFNNKIQLTIAIDVKYRKGKRGKKGNENLGFVVYGINWNPGKVSTIYRKRFAIESSYRMRNLVKPKTSSKNPTIRYFYALVSFLLKNVWVTLQIKHFTIVKPGPQTMDEDLFRFDIFILLVAEWVRRKLRIRLAVECLK